MSLINKQSALVSSSELTLLKHGNFVAWGDPSVNKLLGPVTPPRQGSFASINIDAAATPLDRPEFFVQPREGSIALPWLINLFTVAL